MRIYELSRSALTNVIRSPQTAAFTLLSLLLLLVPVTVQAHGPGHDPLKDVHFEQKLDTQVPLHLAFYDESGAEVQLSDYLNDKPVVLQLGYYECPMLCDLVFEELASSLRELKDFNIGEEFDVVSVSIDPDETPADAASKKRLHVSQYGRESAKQGWHFLTGRHQSIDKLADAIGFQFVYDEEKDEYAHPSGVVILTPEGDISRYVYGIDYDSRDLRLALVQASENKIGSAVDQFLLLCYQYDPVQGKYTFAIMNILRLAAIATALGLGLSLIYLSRQGKDEPHVPDAGQISGD